MEKLRESWLFDRTQYTLLNESEIKAHNISNRLTESQSHLSLQEVLAAGQAMRSNLQEKDAKVMDEILGRLKETGIQNTFKVWKLPVGRYGNLNGNKRVYPKKLWENVRDKQANTWKGFVGLCDHPVADNDPGEFKNQAVIWHDMSVGDDDQTVYGYGSFVGPFGHLAQEILEHGGRVGTSSSGFGDVDPVTKSVDPETYIIERLADLVLNPSQGTFGTVNCPHTPGEFLDDVHSGATIEFNKYKAVRESVLPRSKIKNFKENNQMADQQNPQKFNAAQPAGTQPAQNGSAAPTGQAPAAQAAPAQGAAAAPSGQQPQQQQQVQESKMGTLTKVEEKAFRKYVKSFIDDASKMDNPIQRLNECVDILNCFDEGNCPDLKEALTKQLMEEKATLEKLVETVVLTEKEYDMPITKFRAAAERNTAQGILLQEQVTDYKELCEGLSKRNVQLRKENEEIKKLLNINKKLTEKKIMTTSKEIVDVNSDLSALQEENATLKEKNERLIERVSKLALSNKEFEKENDQLVAKIKEAGEIMKSVKEEKQLNETKETKINAGIIKLQERIKEQEKIINELESNYINQSKRFDKLHENFENYKKEVNDTYNPVAHMIPKASERVGKYLNLRENKGVEVEAYWSDMTKKYGEAILPFEDKIRGAKTLREATSAFLKYKNEIDPDFAVAQPAEFAYRNRAERVKMYEHLNQINPLESYRNSSTEQKNAEFLENLTKQGLI